MTAIEQITTVAQKLGWQVETSTDKPNLVQFEFQQYTPYGQDFGFSVEMKDNDTDGLLQEIGAYYEDFDPTMKPICGLARTGTAKTVHLTISKTS